MASNEPENWVDRPNPNLPEWLDHTIKQRECDRFNAKQEMARCERHWAETY